MAKTPPVPRTRLGRLVARLVYAADGTLRAGAIFGTIVAATIVVGVVTAVVLVAAGVSNPNAVATWSLTIFLLIKVPVLGLLWWLLVRHVERPGDESLTDEDVAGLIARLRAEADRVAGLSDAPRRLAHLREEAWFVADRAPDSLKADAVTLALQIQEREDAAARVRRPRPNGLS